MKGRILLDSYYLPGDLERRISAFVEHYNHVRYHESIENFTPADVHLEGRRDPRTTQTHQACRHRKPPLAAPTAGRLTSNP
jgi:putative transposase